MASDVIAGGAGQRDDELRRIAEIATTMTAERRQELAGQWRARADALDDYARRTRRDGDFLEAEDAETAATDYRAAAEWLELAA